jgi:hypothetical protein
LYEGAKKSKCPKLLLDSLRAALNVTAEDLYAHGPCASDPTSGALRYEPLDRRERDLGPAVPVPEPADVPANG